MVFMSISSDTNIVEVAEDVRNIAPIIVAVCCSDPDQASEMYVELVKDQIGPPRNWNKEPRKRPPPELLQFKYRCQILNGIVVGGKEHFVEDLKVQAVRHTPDGADVMFVSMKININVQGINQWTLAVFGPPSSQCSRGTWDTVAKAVVENSVRLMVGDFGGRNVFSGGNGLEETLRAVRKRMQTHLCALKLQPEEWSEMAGETSTMAVVVNGPVELPPPPSKGSNAELTFAALEEPKDDMSIAWKSLREYWTKRFENEFIGVERIFVYLGSSKGGRSQEAIKKRAARSFARRNHNKQNYIRSS